MRSTQPLLGMGMAAEEQHHPFIIIPVDITMSNKHNSFWHSCLLFCLHQLPLHKRDASSYGATEEQRQRGSIEHLKETS